MRTSLKLRATSELQRKSPKLPVYVVIPGEIVALWRLGGTTIVEGSANGVSFGRRTIKAWGKGSKDWFMEFTAPFCVKAKLSVGDQVRLEIELADMSPPQELERILSSSKKLEASWLALSEAARRDAGEHIRSAKTQQARDRRAALFAKKLQ